MGSTAAINIPHQWDYGFPGAPRSVIVEVPKPSPTVEAAGEFGKSLGAIVSQPDCKDSDPGGLGLAGASSITSVSLLVFVC